MSSLGILQICPDLWMIFKLVYNFLNDLSAMFDGKLSVFSLDTPRFRPPARWSAEILQGSDARMPNKPWSVLLASTDSPRMGQSWAIFCINPPSIGHQIWPMLLLLVSFPSFAFARCGFCQISKIPSMLCWVHLGGISCYLWLPLQMGLFENWGGPQICLRSKMRMIPPKNCRGFTNIFRPTYTQLVQFAQFFQSLVFLASNYM